MCIRDSYLADDISVIDHGQVIAEGTADELKAQVGGHRVVVTLVDAAQGPTAQEVLDRLGADEVQSDAAGRTLSVPVTGGPETLQRVLAALGEAGVQLHDAGMRRPTLDDVFLALTGREHADDTETEGVA